MKTQIFIPNEFQSGAQKNIEECILEGKKAALVVMPTGTGKTYLAAQWFRSLLENNPETRLLYVCHNQDILSQANDKEFENCLSDFDIPRGYYNKSEKNIGQVTFATIQTLGRNLDKLPFDYFDYIIVDEAHHYRAKSFEKTIRHFSPKFLLGMTATPNRMDGRPLSDVFGRTIYSASISDGIKNRLLSKIKYYYVDNDIDFSEIKHDYHGRYEENDLNKKLCVKEYDDAIIKEYKETVKQKYNRKKTICFCATVEHAYRMEKLFNGNGIKAAALTGKRFSETGKEITVHSGKRRQIISMFKDGDYDIIFVRDLFNEGIDIPDADCIMMLRPTESSRIFTQQIGRGLRVWKGKDYLLALDFTGNCFKCDINYEILNDIFEIDIEKDVRDKIRNNDSSEIIIENIGCEVRLSKRKIDVIKYSEGVTKEDLIKNYYNIKEQLGNKMPSSNEMEKYGKISIHEYVRKFGTWSEFLLEIEGMVKLRRNIPDEELIRHYLELKKELNRVPTSHDMKMHGKFSDTVYTNRFGSWYKFLETIGEEAGYKPTTSGITKEDLIRNYWDLKNKYPDLTSGMVNKANGSRFHRSTYCNQFGSWNKFLETIGEMTKYREKVTRDELIKNYLNLKNKYHDVTYDKLTRRNGSRFGGSSYTRHFGSWGKFLEIMGEATKYKENTPEEELIKNYLDLRHKYPGLTSSTVTKKNGSRFNKRTYFKRFGNWKKFLEKMGEKQDMDKKCKKNIVIIQDYTPKNPLSNQVFKKSGSKSRINARELSGYRYGGSDNKDKIRHNIIEKIKDDDVVLVLESPELGTLKEIDKQGKHPKKIIIPNHLEFDEVAQALNGYDTNLNIELINTSVLQYIVDHPDEHINFLWLDYCGAFSYYVRDLEMVFQREIRDMKLILTYNVFDPKKQDDSYYFTNVIGYVLKKLCGKNEILLMEDVSQRYKKTMFSVGFDIKKSA
jgi:superfamily II DNA or RNA helicase